MPWTNEHVNWMTGPTRSINTSEGKTIEFWEFNHEADAAILSAWAKHFRNHYCLDSEIDASRRGPNLSRKDYLNQLKFPDPTTKPGPSIRSGDFGEILVADFLQYKLNFWVPRSRYSNKAIRNESTKGCDIIGFRMKNANGFSPEDVLAIFEAKAQFTGSTPNLRLQDAVKGSAKDQLRKAESLNAAWQRHYDKGLGQEASIIERFQDFAGNSYRELYGAAALFTSNLIDDRLLAQTTTVTHPNNSNLHLFVFHGPAMMALVHQLYERAANEA